MSGKESNSSGSGNRTSGKKKKKGLIKRLSLKKKKDNETDVRKVKVEEEERGSVETLCSVEELDKEPDDVPHESVRQVSPLENAQEKKTDDNKELSDVPSTPVNTDTTEDSEGIETPTQTEFETSGGTKKECLYKILVIGELGTGKTSIIKRYVHQFFSQHYRATIGVDFALKVLNWDQNTVIRLQLWDIAGQERFGNMTRVYYKEAVGAFIVFDVTRVATFDAVAKWKQDLDSKVQLPDGSPIPCVLLANKCDQQKEGIVNQPNKMAEYCDEHSFTAWFETSAKDNINIEEAAKTLVNQILANDTSSDNGRAKDPSRFPLDSTSDSADRNSSCSC